MKLDEAAIRAKVIELYDGCNATRMDLWLLSGITAGVLDADLVERVLQEELPRRSQPVREYWMEPCDHCRRATGHRATGQCRGGR